MMKLGVIVNIYGRSSVEPIFVSAGAQSYKQFASDTRSVLYNLNSPHKEQGVEFFDIVRIEKDVVLLVLNKYIPGPDGNVLSAMITIPNGVNISGKELETIVGNTKKILLNSESYEQLKIIFDKDYEENSFSLLFEPCMQNSNSDQFAYRKYGETTGYELYEILDSLFQNYYSQYKAVFLIDATSTITPKDGLEDLTKKKIMKDVVLLYPNNLPKDVSIKVNNQPFLKSLGFKEGEKVSIVYSRSGFESIKEDKILQGTENSIKVGVSNLSWKVVLRRNMFIVYSEDSSYQKPLTNVTITVKGKPFYNSDSFSESELKEKTEIIVKCDGYEDYKKTDVLLKDGKNPSDIRIDVRMVKKKTTLRYCVAATDGEDINFTRVGKDLKPNVSPLHGYQITSQKHNSDGSICLEPETDPPYSGSKPLKWAKILIFVIICVFACIGICSTGKFVYTNITHKPIDNPDPDCFTTTDTTKNKENTIQEPPKVSLTEAEIKYLENHTEEWDSIEMSKQSKQLAELYIDVNNRHYDKIIGKWASILSELNLDYWDKIVTAATNPKAGKDKAYCKDGKITIEQYLQMTGNDFSGPEGKKKAAVQQSKAGNVAKEKTEKKKSISSLDGE